MAGPFALTSLANVREYLGIAVGDISEDTFLDKLIDRATSRIESRTKRKLKKRSLTETYDGDGTRFLVLREYPITAVTEVNVDFQRDFLANTALDLNSIVISSEEGKIAIGARDGNVFTGIFPSSTRTIQVKYDAGFDTVPDALEDVAIRVVALSFDRAREGADGVASEGALGRSISWIDGLPADVRETLDDFTRKG